MYFLIRRVQGSRLRLVGMMGCGDRGKMIILRRVSVCGFPKIRGTL